MYFSVGILSIASSALVPSARCRLTQTEHSASQAQDMDNVVTSVQCLLESGLSYHRPYPIRPTEPSPHLINSIILIKISRIALSTQFEEPGVENSRENSLCMTRSSQHPHMLIHPSITITSIHIDQHFSLFKFSGFRRIRVPCNLSTLPPIPVKCDDRKQTGLRSSSVTQSVGLRASVDH